MTTATEPVTIEGVDLDAEVPCVGWNRQVARCAFDALADFFVVTCGGNRLPMCERCIESAELGRCLTNKRIETGREHFRIVEVLR